MAKAVRFSRFGGPEVLEVVEVPTPEPGDGELLVEVAAAGLTPVDSAIREDRDPTGRAAPLPSGVGREFAGVVVAAGPGASQFDRGDEVMGFVDGGALATHLVAPEANVVRRPPGLSWEVAGSLYTSGTTAWAAVERLALTANDTVVVTAAAGGVGCLAVQFARLKGAHVLGTSADQRFDFLRQFGVVPIGYGPRLAERVGAAADGLPITAFLDFLGGEAEVATALGVPPGRILTTLDPDAVDLHGAVRVEPGDAVAFARVAQLVAARRVRLPIADVFPLERVADAYRALDRRDAPGKIVLGFHVVAYPGQVVEEPDLKEQDVTLGVPTPHARVAVEEQVPAAIGDGSVRRRHRAAHAAPGAPDDR
ncbi:NADP-dependent oxidoreductase [Agromyces protaetiae]|uniref:NADP-dependent oxidoreductase n=1 Tax=Agromyces protaetiae TaxID=2509455 RepID=UPI0013EC5328|nr:NADP-dependent oxidoreductase [Agromyces protaetiae]